MGSAVARYCRENQIEHEIITKQNYRDFIGKQCDILINSNGNSKKFLANQDPFEDFQLSVSSVRSSLIDIKFDKYVFFSSCDVYNDCSEPSLNDEEALIDISKQSAYGFHKYIAEQCVRHAASDWLVIRFGGFIGEGLKKNPIYDIMHGGPLWLDPGSELQYLNTNVAATLVMELIARNIQNETFNLCGDGLVELEEVIREWGKQVEIKPNSPKVLYNVNVNKVKKYVEIPSSRDAVFDFLRTTDKGAI